MKRQFIRPLSIFHILDNLSTGLGQVAKEKKYISTFLEKIRSSAKKQIFSKFKLTYFQ